MNIILIKYIVFKQCYSLILVKKNLDHQEDDKPDHRFFEQLYDYQKNNFIDNKFDKKASEKFHCQCNLCYEQQNSIINQSQQANYQSAIQLNQKSIEKDFIFVLRRLQPPNKLIRGLRIMVPETFGLIQGDIKFLVYTSKDKTDKKDLLTLKYMKQKEKLTLSYLRKFLNERRNKSKLELMENQASAKHSSINTSQDSILQINIDPKHREAVIVKYDDNTVQVLTDFEFLQLMMRRKVDPIWQHIQYIQNYITPRRVNFELLAINFNYDIDVNDILFKRARHEIAYLNGEISKASEDYVPVDKEEDFERQLGPNEYCKYVTYKVFHYAETFGSSKIEKATFYYIQDKNDIYQLINIEKLQSREVLKRQFFDSEVLLRGKTRKIEENNDENERLQQLIEEEREYAAKIFQELMILEGGIKQSGDQEDMQERNILAISKQDISNKKQIYQFQKVVQQFYETNDPFRILQKVVYEHKINQEKKNKILKSRNIFRSQKIQLQRSTVIQQNKREVILQENETKYFKLHNVLVKPNEPLPAKGRLSLVRFSVPTLKTLT